MGSCTTTADYEVDGRDSALRMGREIPARQGGTFLNDQFQLPAR
jgi:hypothetical protein